MALIQKNELKQLHQATRAAIDQTAKEIRKAVITTLIGYPHLKVPPAFWNKVANNIDGDCLNVGSENADDNDDGCSSALVTIEMSGNQRICLAKKIYLETIKVNLDGGVDFDDADYMNEVGAAIDTYGPFIKVYYSRNGRTSPLPVMARSFANIFAEIRRREKLEIIL